MDIRLCEMLLIHSSSGYNAVGKHQAGIRRPGFIQLSKSLSLPMIHHLLSTIYFLLKYSWCTILCVTSVQYSDSQFLKVMLHLSL